MSVPPRPVRVEPEAALELVGLIQQQMARLISGHEPKATTQPNVTYQLDGALERLIQELRGDRLIRWRRLTPRRSRTCARRCRWAGAWT
jgi:hypothetical protein